MEEYGKIEPHRITKPIQLLAAWLLGLIVVNGAFLVAAAQITEPDWASGVLVVASIVNVPLFLISMFLLQTKFRPEMQEDAFYSRYLESKTGNTERKVTAESFVSIRDDFAHLEKVVAEKVLNGMSEAELQKAKWSSVTVMLNRSLSDFDRIGKELTQQGIPVHETFGGGTAGCPEVFNIGVGDGFDVEQIRKLVEVLSSIKDGWISYAYDDSEHYGNKVLIGAYGAYEHGIELSEVKLIIERADITVAEVYKIFGKLDAYNMAL
jgi:hypothetical protein